ncbi:hypothetical protein NDU88_001809 [Pleurodeles waltl]|uniref:Uncharacterized protein n=1 Tax=Pleurodeles waltl TaxID=8319 RepID=A0AAV7NG72_PLEWA|nr:hypothetical protein NDU88_001809 [Pleurodeles waltl]
MAGFEAPEKLRFLGRRWREPRTEAERSPALVPARAVQWEKGRRGHQCGGGLRLERRMEPHTFVPRSKKLVLGSRHIRQEQCTRRPKANLRCPPDDPGKKAKGKQRDPPDQAFSLADGTGKKGGTMGCGGTGNNAPRGQLGRCIGPGIEYVWLWVLTFIRGEIDSCDPTDGWEPYMRAEIPDCSPRRAGRLLQ